MAAVISADDEQDAIRIANDSPFGLGAAVFTRDRARGERIAVDELEAGACFVNGLVLSVIKAESNFNAQARSHKNAQGLMQLIPETEQRFGVKNAFDPVQNIQGGMAYLRWLLEATA